MGNWKKLASGAAGAAGGAGLDVDDVFRIHPYVGNGTAGRTINVGLDMATEGGLVITKRRFGGTASFMMHDTGRGTNVNQALQGTAGEFTSSNYIRDLASTGFTVGSDYDVNGNGQQLCSWNFLENPDFFEVKTFSTTYNTDPSYLTHSLNCDLGMAVFIAKNPGSQSYNRIVWHKDVGTNYYLRLNDTVSRRYDSSNPIVYTPSQKQFTFNYPMSDIGDRMIHGGQETTNWTAYFFGHHNNTGVFGPSGDQDIIKCGSYTGSTSSPFPKINLGFEPQFILLKNLTGSGNWHVIDTTRGVASGQRYQRLYWNDDAVEENGGALIHINPNGFEFTDWSGDINQGGYTYIYMAIRKGQMSAPTSASDVFNVAAGTYGAPDVNGYVSGFKVDMAFERDAAGTDSWDFGTRLMHGRALATHENWAETDDGNMHFDFPDKFYGTGRDSDNYGWMWKRAPKYFDLLTYIGTGSSSLTLDHNLEATPEMMWVKRRSGTSDWKVYHKDLPNLNSYLRLNHAFSSDNSQTNVWPTAPTDTQITIGNYTGDYTGGGDKGLALLFASLSGISKVGSYSGNSGTQTIDCGFSNGAALVIVKRYDSSGQWIVWDNERGIVSGNDPYLQLHSSVAQTTGYDAIDPHSSGFTLNNVGTGTNDSGASYIFYAVAA